MSKIKIHLKKSEKEMVKSYADAHGMTSSEFARTAMLERIEDELDLQELTEAMREWEKEPITYSHEEAWKC